MGLKYGNEQPNDMDIKLSAYKKVRVLNQQVVDIHGASNCAELLKKHATDAEVAERSHHKIICRRVVGEVAELVYDMLNN